MSKKRTVNIDLKQYGMFLALIAIFLIFYFLTGGANATPTNINNLVMQNGYVVILATGMLLCVLTGNVDLGVGSVVALTGAASAILVVDFGAPIWLAFIVALLIGMASGVFVGIFVAYLGVPPFVATLATMLMGRGLTYTILAAQTKGPLPEAYVKVGAGFLPTIKINFGSNTVDLICIFIAILATLAVIFFEIKDIKTKKKYNFMVSPIWQIVLKNIIILGIIWFFFFKLANYNGVPIVLVIMFVLVLIYHFVTSKTVAGRQIYALGGNAKAARLAGVNTKNVFFWVDRKSVV